MDEQPLQNMSDKKVTVLGAARSGLAAARMLKRQGTPVFVSDIAEKENKTAQVRELEANGIEYEFGKHSQRCYDADMVVLSPGIPVKSEAVQQFLHKKIPVYSEIEVASWFCKAPIIAITGSNGKTTTTTLIGEMLKKIYPDAIVAGNIGLALSDFVEDSYSGTWVVVEVSSFQLETIDSFHPRIAAVLNFAPNHLDRYDRYEDYLKAKWRITKNLKPEDHLIYNLADQNLSSWVEPLNVQKHGFDINGRKESIIEFVEGCIRFKDAVFMREQDIALRGMHNYMNVMAAILAADLAGVPADAIKGTLSEFSGVEHRLEFVREFDGVRYINDSKATTVESLSYALRSFNVPVVLIAGGKDKGSNFSALNQLIRERTKAVVLIGSATEKMAETWKTFKPIHPAQSMEDAVNKARSIAAPGEVVLLSPACASFDMFNDFEDRGRCFKAIVSDL
ncbi:MAG: UDP-N-acetylmuramoyl-L-alanine--D-glutamate ligase [Caldithrix sp.]|nr:UDP-N-acetylmuramoyl-L-alanine--D-glutamate ligase [Caldithrix sp.]